MPQMYPLMWFTLFFMFSMLLLLMMTKMFFSTNYIKSTPLDKNSQIPSKNKNWSW